MEELLTVSGLSKTFHLIKKTAEIKKRQTEKVKVAVDDLSFCTYRGEGFWIIRAQWSGKDNQRFAC